MLMFIGLQLGIVFSFSLLFGIIYLISKNGGVSKSDKLHLMFIGLGLQFILSFDTVCYN